MQKDNKQTAFKNAFCIIDPPFLLPANRPFLYLSFRSVEGAAADLTYGLLTSNDGLIPCLYGSTLFADK
jgi:hypothetical protein